MRSSTTLSVGTSEQDGSAGLVNYLAMEGISDDAMFAELFTDGDDCHFFQTLLPTLRRSALQTTTARPMRCDVKLRSSSRKRMCIWDIHRKPNFSEF